MGLVFLYHGLFLKKYTASVTIFTTVAWLLLLQQDNEDIFRKGWGLWWFHSQVIGREVVDLLNFLPDIVYRLVNMHLDVTFDGIRGAIHFDFVVNLSLWRRLHAMVGNIIYEQYDVSYDDMMIKPILSFNQISLDLFHAPDLFIFLFCAFSSCHGLHGLLYGAYLPFLFFVFSLASALYPSPFSSSC